MKTAHTTLLAATAAAFALGATFAYAQESGPEDLSISGTPTRTARSRSLEVETRRGDIFTVFRCQQ